MEATTEKKASLTSQSAWILFAKVVGFFLTTLFPLLIVRYLTKDGVGTYRQIFLIVSNAVLILPFGLSMSAYYFLNRERANHGATVFNILAFNFIVGGLAFAFFLFFPSAVGATFQNGELPRLSWLIGLLIWVSLFAGFLETVALARQEARLTAFLIVGGQLLKTVLMTIAILVFSNVESLVWAAVILSVVQSIALLFYVATRYPKFWQQANYKFAKTQASYAFPTGLSVLLYVGQTDLHNYFVSHGFSAAEFAIYSQGCFQLPLITLLYDSVGSVMIPRMSQMQHEGKKREMLQLAISATRKLAFFYFPIFGFLMIVAYDFVTTLFTTEYAASVPIFRANLLALPLFCVVADPIARAFPSAVRWLLKLRIGIFVILLALFFSGVGRFSLLTMISIVVFTLVYEKLALAWISAKHLDFKRADFNLLRPIGRLAVAAAAAAVFLFAFVYASRDFILGKATEISRSILSLFRFSDGGEFFGGAIYLGLMLLIYSAIYLIFARFLNVIDEEDQLRAISLWNRVADKVRRRKLVGNVG